MIQNPPDEDEAFFILVAPYVRKMSDENKLDFLMNVLQLLKNINRRAINHQRRTLSHQLLLEEHLL